MLLNRFGPYTRRMLSLALAGAIVSPLVIFLSGGFTADEPNLWPELPSFTMKYELAYGQVARVGTQDPVDSKQVLRLDYTDKDHWVETVIESADIVTSYGTFSAVGSYRRVNGTEYTEYSATDGSTYTETLGDDLPDDAPADAVHKVVPGSFLHPFSIASVGQHENPVVDNGHAAATPRPRPAYASEPTARTTTRD